MARNKNRLKNIALKIKGLAKGTLANMRKGLKANLDPNVKKGLAGIKSQGRFPKKIKRKGSKGINMGASTLRKLIEQRRKNK